MDDLINTFLKHSRYMNLSDALYISLKESIINNNLKHNKRLKDVVLAKELNISRTPVREVLLLLEKNDFIVSDSTKGYVIKEFSIHECISLVAYVKTLRRFSSGSVAKHMTNSKISLLSNVKFTLQNYQCYQDLHLKIAEYTNNQFIINESKRVYEKLMMIYNYYTANTASTQEQFLFYCEEERIKLLEAFKEKDSHKAEHIIDKYSHDLLLVIKRMYALNFDVTIKHISVYNLIKQ
ncbi:MAG: GntR family transcriptional regulator [Eubacteriales bacterium]